MLHQSRTDGDRGLLLSLQSAGIAQAGPDLMDAQGIALGKTGDGFSVMADRFVVAALQEVDRAQVFMPQVGIRVQAVGLQAMEAS